MSIRNTANELRKQLGIVLDTLKRQQPRRKESTMSEAEAGDSIRSAAEVAAENAAKIVEKQKEEAPEMVSEPASEASAEPAQEALPAELTQKLESLEKELQEQKDKHVRLVAEFDNFRRRTAREAIEAADLAEGRALMPLFSIVDNFDRAFSEAPAEGDWTPSDPAGFAKGVQLIRDQLHKVLTDAGLERIPDTGAEFDPNFHDALTQMPHESIPKDHVIMAHASGWKKGDKVLRHAQVIVSSGPAA